MGETVFLVEYKMLWAGQVVREGVEEVRAYTEHQAEKKVIEYLDIVNKKAEKHILAIVSA